MKILSWLLITLFLFAPSHQAGAQEQDKSPSEKIRKALAAKSKFLFPGNPLGDVLPFISQNHEFAFEIDEQARPSLRLEVRLTDTGRLYVLLTKLLDQAKLKWVARGEKIIIEPIPEGYATWDEEKLSPEVVQSLNELTHLLLPEGGSLQEVLQFLNGVSKIDFLIDQDSLGAAGFDESYRIEPYVGVSVFKFVLSDLLYKTDLTWTTHGDRVIIKAK